MLTEYCLACGQLHSKFPCELCGACEVQALLPCLVACPDGKVRVVRQALTPSARRARMEHSKRGRKPWHHA